MFAEGPAVPALPELFPLSFISVSLHFSTVANLEISFSFSVHQNPSSPKSFSPPKWLMRRNEMCRMTYTQATGMCLSFAVWLKTTYRLPASKVLTPTSLSIIDHHTRSLSRIHLVVFSLIQAVPPSGWAQAHGIIKAVGYNPQVWDPPMIVQRWSPFSPQDLKNILKTTTFTSPQRINIRRAGIGSACFIPQHFKTFNTHSWTTTFTWPQRINIRQAGITSISKDGTTIEDIQIYAATTYRRLGEQGDWNTLGSVEHEDAQMSAVWFENGSIVTTVIYNLPRCMDVQRGDGARMTGQKWTAKVVVLAPRTRRPFKKGVDHPSQLLTPV
ncbi:hypothetical protein IW262DRAFT_1299273 [Armillaria fumosa]|nr:hypothetical protein IW262DRAFT_1299273 [Armillaria fumosa]